MSQPLVALVGNPNTGKTTLFNRLTGQRARVGNYPGVTVERRMGNARLPSPDRSRGDTTVTEVEVLDVPGAYSLCARSAEEQIAINAVLGLDHNPTPTLVVVVMNAGELSRNLYLALQLAELDVPLVVALNMIDEAAFPPNHHAIQEWLGVPVVPVSARFGQGMIELKETIAGCITQPVCSQMKLEYPDEVMAMVARITPVLPQDWQGSERHNQALSLWVMSSVGAEDELVGIDPPLRDAAQVDPKEGARLDEAVARTRFGFIDDHLDDLTTPVHPRGLTDRIDRVLLHPVAGFGLFMLIMLVMFQSLFAWADPAIGAIEGLFGWLGEGAGAVIPEGFVRDLVVEGLINGVGSVVVFLPQILLLFFFLGLMENSGYMARVAYLMDRIMRALGLHGRAFVPMLSGFACAIPAVMATRTMERQRDRTLTMMVVPLMSCSARLPVYTLIIAALFPASQVFGVFPVQGLLMVSMYLFSTIIALLAAAVLGRTVLKGQNVPLILDLPPYRVPSLRDTLRMMWERSRVFLTEAGTVILVCTVILWGLLSYPKVPEPGPKASPEQIVLHEAQALEHSYAGRLGKAIEPVIAPLGFDWRMGVGIVGAFAAREVFVSTMGLIYGVGEEVDEESDSLRDRIKGDVRADGTPTYTPLVGMSLMVFFALACQCMSTLAVVKRETQGYRWPAFLFVYMTVLAWVSSFVVYQGGRLLGLG